LTNDVNQVIEQIEAHDPIVDGFNQAKQIFDSKAMKLTKEIVIDIAFALLPVRPFAEILWYDVVRDGLCSNSGIG